MILVKEINEREDYTMEEDINSVLKELQRNNKKIIDIKYIYNGAMHEINALIIYEE